MPGRAVILASLLSMNLPPALIGPAQPKLDQRRAVGPLSNKRIDTTDMADATLTPVQTAQKMFDLALAKNNQRADIVFFKAFIAGAFLSFGGLLHVIVSGGSAGITSSNPGLVKVIVLQGQELLTSNMMTVPMLLVKRAAPWWSLPMNWLIGGNHRISPSRSLFFAGVLVKASGILSAEPYPTYVRSFVLQWIRIGIKSSCAESVSARSDLIQRGQAMAATEVISKIVAIFIPIFTFVAAGFDHGKQDMAERLDQGLTQKANRSLPSQYMTVADYIKKSLIASFLGNVVGALLVALPFMYFFNPLFERESRDLEEQGSSSGSSLVDRVISRRIDSSVRKE
ncbi:formate/nitrite transporter domain-containing protein [Rhizoctonia solani AG-1 IA]|uniref:Formate/nitrite transporter domain-containing protein n=1 Tax=Thanatephorus cucumeris (strain AG1-IA) TaxID=983506 RepID=L8X9S2_THACA|nr:formate/nitrite transporter domain-containing protein [Rhizoctonia solani AG-1 IA]